MQDINHAHHTNLILRRFCLAQKFRNKKEIMKIRIDDLHGDEIRALLEEHL
ncbi:hypothetical protein ACO0K0_04235 [Undibacterium sp. SXout11W]|uniref:hypothetical protein n=1 Tax=Undibacterium sp. SXout11W TaxID=3413050 RepID=UPI003BF08AE6